MSAIYFLILFKRLNGESAIHLILRDLCTQCNEFEGHGGYHCNTYHFVYGYLMLILFDFKEKENWRGEMKLVPLMSFEEGNRRQEVIPAAPYFFTLSHFVSGPLPSHQIIISEISLLLM